jgi:hypothetical protein
MGICKWAEFLCYIFPPFKWDPYPFFYRLEGARYLDENLSHEWLRVSVNSPIAYVFHRKLSFFHSFVGPCGLFWVSQRVHMCSNGLGHVSLYKRGFSKSCLAVIWQRKDMRWPDAR